MNVRVLAKLLGLLLILEAVALAIPTGLAALLHGPDLPAFLETLAATSLLGSLLWYLFRDHPTELNHRTGFALVTVSWCLFCLVGALPYYLSGALPHIVDALFESVSGFTGTGASVFTDMEALSQELLLWRSMTQWIGGLGIIVIFLALFPAFGRGGVLLYQTEVTGVQKEKLTPRVRDAAGRLLRLYLWYTLILIALLQIGGMSLFDAINHGLTAIATGGFSTRNTGIAYYQSIFIDYTLILFMFLSSINFALQYRMIFFRDFSGLWSTEFRWYISVLTLAVLMLGLLFFPLVLQSDMEKTFRELLFTVVNITSTTGYTYNDYTLWPIAAQILLLFLMSMGGMQGSTAGGVKCIRVLGAFLQVFREVKHCVHPSATLSVRVDKHSLQENTLQSIQAVLIAFFFTLFFLTLFLSMQGHDISSSASLALSALSNIGPALGAYGPMGNFASLNDASIIALSAGMLLGKLEFFAVIVLFSWEYWRK